MKLVKDQHGEIAVYLLVAIMVLTMIFALITEYLRVHTLIDQVEAQLTQAANVSLEDAMRDSYRADGIGQISTEIILASMDNYMKNVMVISNMAHLSVKGNTIYRISNLDIDTTEAPPAVVIACTLEIPSMFTFFSELSVPIKVSSRNRRLD